MRQRIDRPARQWAEAEIAIAEKHYPQAIDLFRRGDALPDGPRYDNLPVLDAQLGRTFDLAGQGDSAIVYLERYITAPFLFRLWGDVDGYHRAGAHKRLGELYEARGDRQRALTQYQKFVDLWKGADPELQPKVADVRKRIARLSAAEGR
jgi:tetratricopeptide (TPR) repeat protein